MEAEEDGCAVSADVSAAGSEGSDESAVVWTSSAAGSDIGNGAGTGTGCADYDAAGMSDVSLMAAVAYGLTMV